jgi:hypothetical protein
VDDLLTGGNNPNNFAKTMSELINSLRNVKWELAKAVSNSPEVNKMLNVVENLEHKMIRTLGNTLKLK